MERKSRAFRKDYGRVTGAQKSRAAMISRHDGQPGTPKGGAAAVRARMIERSADTSRPQNAEAARAAMIARHDGAEHETQQYVGDMMNTGTSRAWEETMQGRTPDEKMVAACFRDIYAPDGPGHADSPSEGGGNAEGARARMIERMSGACPDRFPPDYKPLPGNDR